jgi:hypothetical protein
MSGGYTKGHNTDIFESWLVVRDGAGAISFYLIVCTVCNI